MGEDFAKDVGRPYCEGVWLYLVPWDVVRLRTSSCLWSVPRKYWPHGELFFFLVQKGAFYSYIGSAVKSKVPFKTLEACALIVVHLMKQKVNLDQTTLLI